MAMSSPPIAPAALAGTTAADVTAYIKTQNANQRGVVRVSASGPFRLNIVAGTDADTPTPYVVRQVSSSTITVDGATATYTENAVMEDFAWPAIGKVQIYNPGAGSINWVADWRLYE